LIFLLTQAADRRDRLLRHRSPHNPPPRLQRYRVHPPATHNRPSTGAQPPCTPAPPRLSIGLQDGALQPDGSYTPAFGT
jgi:hypothetical protein